MKYIASVSFGKDSLAMLLYILEKNLPLDEVLFYDTGMEFQAIYNLRDKIVPILRERGVVFTELHPERPFLFDMLEKEVYSKQKGHHRGYGWCGGVCRWGTTAKTKALDAHAKGAMQYVGIAFDEKDRLARLTPNKISPIAVAKMTEEDCLNFCRDRGFSWNESGIDLYDILDRVSCWCCCNKNRKELKNMYLHLPQYWERLKELQSKIDRPMKKFIRKGISYGNVFDMEKVFEQEVQNGDKKFNRR